MPMRHFNFQSCGQRESYYRRRAEVMVWRAFNILFVDSYVVLESGVPASALDTALVAENTKLKIFLR
jgi:hypothetical protein